jgi:hypothetical protein
MEIELIKSKDGHYQIWADNKYINHFVRQAGESAAAYDQRAEKEFDQYCQKLKAMQNKTSQVKKKFTL